MTHANFPSFDDLPLVKDGPPGNAWGLFGSQDELGMLNLLTERVVAEAAQEIKDGKRFHLDWSMDMPSSPAFGRQQFQHHLLHSDEPTFMNDDTLTFNTQSSTQWDGFRHYAYQRSRLFYNGHRQEEFQTSPILGIDRKFCGPHSITLLTLAGWVKKGGIIGRGVLLDWASWAAANGIAITPFESAPIKLEHLVSIVAEQDIKFKTGDILFVRCGYADAYSRLSPQEREEFPRRKPGGMLGLEATKDSLRWLWENRFSAVAGDSPSFERGSVLGSYNDPDVTVHQWLLAGWGMPIGEMFNLEGVSAHCRKTGRYSFFVSSVPIHVPGGVASPPNAVAIF
ncbi:uncharacterized protein Z518_03587 [Rhinocladiella mackenziei CBS 650.93]|uniref:Cyclase n=1 Tax=Rhinocladiella mackenziei CBS 650.93 TaxID=1442369 RepID=A0A0D2J922_9EURO|nr:uncharacterized protein Z518_03587 [Rhinocladiella mackenziei CBS 650.93]KIX05615.1 hypothetical protein Z518_03587 [Rhinocladiella mackenziei CBS 650.93]